MKDLLKTNCFDTQETMIIVGKATQGLANFGKYLWSMLARGKVKKIIFATVDKSPHCVQLHYVIKELENAIDISNIEIINYVAVNDKLNEIPLEIISLSKNLSKLKERMQ